MIAHDSVEAFLASPIGGYVVGRCFVVRSHSQTLAGSIGWGEPDERAVRQLIALWDFGRNLPHAERIDVITDGHALTRPDGTVYDLVTAYVRQRAPEFGARYHRHAIIFPPGLTGAAIAGIFPQVGTDHRWRAFAEPAQAFSWLDTAEARAAQAELAQLFSEASGTTRGPFAVRPVACSGSCTSPARVSPVRSPARASSWRSRSCAPPT